MLSEKALLLEYTLKRISNWLPVICHIVGKLFGENYKYPHISLIQFTPNIYHNTALVFDHWNKLKLKG